MSDIVTHLCDRNLMLLTTLPIHDWILWLYVTDTVLHALWQLYRLLWLFSPGPKVITITYIYCILVMSKYFHPPSVTQGLTVRRVTTTRTSCSPRPRSSSRAWTWARTSPTIRRRIGRSRPGSYSRRAKVGRWAWCYFAGREFDFSLQELFEN